MEFNVTKMETSKDLMDLKHKLAALDGIMQVELKSIYSHDTDYISRDSNRELKS